MVVMSYILVSASRSVGRSLLPRARKGDAKPTKAKGPKTQQVPQPSVKYSSTANISRQTQRCRTHTPQHRALSEALTGALLRPSPLARDTARCFFDGLSDAGSFRAVGYAFVAWT
jgi:hypothetical protein